MSAVAETTLKSATLSCCEVTLQESKISYIFTIKNYSLSDMDNGQCIQSKVFSSVTNPADKNKWVLELYPKGTTSPTYNPSVELYLRLVSSDRSEVSVKFKTSIVDSKNLLTTHGFRRSVFKPGGTVTVENSYLIEKEKLLKKKAELLPDDTLNILCEIIVIVQSKMDFGSAAPCSIPQDLGHLLENQDFSDVTIVAADGREFPAHKAILGARSRVFAAMFKNEMTENKHNRVETVDMEHQVILELLRFIYTGSANMSNISAKLLAAADKYELLGLKDMCKVTLCKCITVENAANTLILAERHLLNDLKAAVIEFIDGNSEKVIKTEGWKKLAKTLPQLIMDAFLFK